MKNKLLKLRRPLIPSFALALAASAAFMVATPTRSQAALVLQDPSNGGTETWDCVFSGAGHNGITFITFSSDFTFTGFEMIAPNQSKIQPENNSRSETGSGSIDGRGNGGGQTNVIIFGFDEFNGTWGFDLKGRFIGSFQRPLGDTNEAVSFVGKVSFGKTPKLTMVSSQDVGKFNYKGVVAAPEVIASSKTIPEISGNWFGYTSLSNQLTLEQFSLTDDGDFPGLFDLEGNGPNYTIEGWCAISAQGKIGFSVTETPNGTNSIQRTTMGSYSNNSKATTAKTTGAQASINIDTGELGPVEPVGFKASLNKQLP